jgi:hypothetical protein
MCFWQSKTGVRLIFKQAINGILLGQDFSLMKMRKPVLLMLLVSWGVVSAQDVITPIKAAIKAGNVDELSKYFNQNLDVTIEGNLKPYSKPQAVFAIGEFFKSHTPTDFTIVHSGASEGGLQYVIGKYVSNKEPYTVLIRVKETNKTKLIHEISFVKEKKSP